MTDAATMNREDIAVFLAALKKLRDGMDSFNCQVVTLNGAGLRLAALCDETAAVAPASAGTLMQELAGVARSLRSFSITIGEALPCFLAAADGVACGMRMLEIETRKVNH
jgi:hypothetical protein